MKSLPETPAAETLQTVPAQQPQIESVQHSQSSISTNPSPDVVSKGERKGSWHSWVTPATFT